jgi:acyl-CoA synthetase (NDP forming)/GNAT superfamily N-acetyltransferase
VTEMAVTGQTYALLADGTTVQIRPAGPGDTEAVIAFHERMSPDNLYLRFFSMSKQAAMQEAKRVTRPPGSDHAALLALLDDRVIGLASFEQAGGPGRAEVAFAVADDMHGRGIATLLLEHLVSIGSARHIEAFCAETLPENTAMLRVFLDAGLRVRRKLADDVVELIMPIPRAPALGEASTYVDAVARRESMADVESLRPLLAPRSVAVIGASRRRRTVGRSILHNITSGGFTGPVYAVNPHAHELEGVRCFRSVSQLPEAPDLAVISVPPPGVAPVAEECGQRGVRSIVVITSALDHAQSTELLAACRRHSMRLVGPNCFGIAVPGIGLNATFAASPPAAGVAGLVMQSGGLGFALLDHLSRIGVGVSSFASVGNKYDVSGNDLLSWWERDDVTRLSVLYLESFGHPRKFARTAQRIGRTMPVLTVYAGRTEEGLRAAASHTAAIATPLISREALFQQAGIVATASLGELLDTCALLATQPVPTGHRVAIVSNAGGAGVLAADDCVENGLSVYQPAGQVREQLGRIIPPGGAVTGPVDTTAAISREDFQRCLELIAADERVDAMLVLVLPTATNDLLPAVCAASIPVPLAAVLLDQADGVRLIPAGGPRHEQVAVPGKIPAYAYPESAARALSQAVKYGAWRSQPPGSPPDFPDLRRADARAVITRFLGRMPGGGWLPPLEVSELLACYGLPYVTTKRTASADAAVAIAAGLGGPVVLKADVPGLLHKTDAGAVALDLRTDEDVRAAFGRFSDEFAQRLSGVLIQPMITSGTEVIIGVVQDPVFGPLVVFGLGGVATEVLGDHTARLAPLTTEDADEMLHAVRAAPLLFGHRGSEAVDIPALTDTLLRVSELAGDLSEVAELDLNPVIAKPDGVFAVDARVRVTSRETADPFLRQLGQLAAQREA